MDKKGVGNTGNNDQSPGLKSKHAKDLELGSPVKMRNSSQAKCRNKRKHH